MYIIDKEFLMASVDRQDFFHQSSILKLFNVKKQRSSGFIKLKQLEKIFKDNELDKSVLDWIMMEMSGMNLLKERKIGENEIISFKKFKDMMGKNYWHYFSLAKIFKTAKYSHLPTIWNCDFGLRYTLLRAIRFYLPYGFHSSDNPPKDNMFPIEMWTRNRSDEELRSVCVWTCVSHRQQPRLIMLVLEVFIFKLLPINWFSTSPIEMSEVTSLQHELRYHTVKYRALVVELLARFCSAFLTCAEAPEIFCCLRNIIKQLKFDLTRLLIIDCNFKENPNIFHFLLLTFQPRFTLASIH